MSAAQLSRLWLLLHQRKDTNHLISELIGSHSVGQDLTSAPAALRQIGISTPQLFVSLKIFFDHQLSYFVDYGRSSETTGRTARDLVRSSGAFLLDRNLCLDVVLYMLHVAAKIKSPTDIIGRSEYLSHRSLAVASFLPAFRVLSLYPDFFTDEDAQSLRRAVDQVCRDWGTESFSAIEYVFRFLAPKTLDEILPSRNRYGGDFSSRQFGSCCTRSAHSPFCPDPATTRSRCDSIEACGDIFRHVLDGVQRQSNPAEAAWTLFDTSWALMDASVRSPVGDVPDGLFSNVQLAATTLWNMVDSQNTGSKYAVVLRDFFLDSVDHISGAGTELLFPKSTMMSDVVKKRIKSNVGGFENYLKTRDDTLSQQFGDIRRRSDSQAQAAEVFPGWQRSSDRTYSTQSNASHSGPPSDPRRGSSASSNSGGPLINRGEPQRAQQSFLPPLVATRRSFDNFSPGTLYPLRTNTDPPGNAPHYKDSKRDSKMNLNLMSMFRRPTGDKPVPGLPPLPACRGVPKELSFCFSASGTRLVLWMRESDHLVRLDWDREKSSNSPFQTGQKLPLLEPHNGGGGGKLTVTLVEGGTLVVAAVVHDGSQNQLIYFTEEGKRMEPVTLATGNTAPIALAVSRDDTKIAVGCGTTVLLYSIKDGKLRLIGKPLPAGEVNTPVNRRIQKVNFSVDSTTLAVATQEPRKQRKQREQGNQRAEVPIQLWKIIEPDVEPGCKVEPVSLDLGTGNEMGLSSIFCSLNGTNLTTTRVFCAVSATLPYYSVLSPPSGKPESLSSKSNGLSNDKVDVAAEGPGPSDSGGQYIFTNSLHNLYTISDIDKSSTAVKVVSFKNERSGLTTPMALAFPEKHIALALWRGVNGDLVLKCVNPVVEVRSAGDVQTYKLGAVYHEVEA